MKKLLSLILVLAMVVCFAACGGNSNSETNGGKTEAASIKFNQDNYSVVTHEYLSLNDKITVEPAGAAVTYSVSDEAVCTITSANELMGVKSGEITLTAASSNGSVKATCKVKVIGLGSVVSFDKEYDGYTMMFRGREVDGGIRNARTGNAPEINLDGAATVVMIPQNMASGVDMTAAVELDYGGTVNDEGWLYKFHGDINSYKGYVVAKNNADAVFEISKMPEGKYYALIISSRDYTERKDYSKRDTAAELKATAISKWFTDAEISSLASKFSNREFAVIELEVKPGETYYFEHVFYVE